MTETTKFQPAFVLRVLAESAGKAGPAEEMQDAFYDFREQDATLGSEQGMTADLPEIDKSKD